jgi:hypothetical protein
MRVNVLIGRATGGTKSYVRRVPQRVLRHASAGLSDPRQGAARRHPS